MSTITPSGGSGLSMDLIKSQSVSVSIPHFINGKDVNTNGITVISFDEYDFSQESGYNVGILDISMPACSIEKTWTVEKSGFYYGFGLYDLYDSDCIISTSAQTNENATLYRGNDTAEYTIKLNGEVSTDFSLNITDMSNNVLPASDYRHSYIIKLNNTSTQIKPNPIFLHKGDIFSIKVVCPKIDLHKNDATNSIFARRSIPKLGYKYAYCS